MIFVTLVISGVFDDFCDFSDFGVFDDFCAFGNLGEVCEFGELDEF